MWFIQWATFTKINDQIKGATCDMLTCRKRREEDWTVGRVIPQNRRRALFVHWAVRRPALQETVISLAGGHFSCLIIKAICRLKILTLISPNEEIYTPLLNKITIINCCWLVFCGSRNMSNISGVCMAKKWQHPIVIPNWCPQMSWASSPKPQNIHFMTKTLKEIQQRFCNQWIWHFCL